MSNEEKRFLNQQVRGLLKKKVSDAMIVFQMMNYGYKKETIKKYIKALKD